ncbi:MAG: hypothetical protein K0B87_09505 [Candidatus Syntrophosphaera sp.]|nr:hypothetical protein [Candidatus Syntrophosphaera sp.]
MMKFALYVSDHGYGHATRMAALASEFIRFGIFVHIRSARPDFLFSGLNPSFSAKEDVSIDVGVRHGKNLVPDLKATRSALIGLMGRRLEIIEREVDFLRGEKIDLIIADIPWLAVEAGTYARVPVFAISNFDWLFIYAGLFVQDSDLKPLLNTIFGLYQRVDRAFRLPLSSAKSMGALRKLEKVGLLAQRKAEYPDLRQKHGLEPKTPLLTCAFGGEGEMELDLEMLCAAFPGQVLSTHASDGIPNHVQVPRDADFADLIHGTDVLLTKPGYSSFAEALQFGKYIIYQPREDYPEEEVLIRGIARYPHQSRLESLNLSKTAWSKLFENIPLGQVAKNHPANANSRIAALIIQRFLELKFPPGKLLSVFDAGSNNLNYALCENGNPQPILTAQIHTGLGRDYKIASDGKVMIPARSLAGFKRRVSEFLVYDQGIDSLKQVIATGIHRHSSASAELSAWFDLRWGIKYRLLSAKEEMELAWLAARDIAPADRNTLIVDVGGFSTEFVSGDSFHNLTGMSLDMGLLTLRKAASEKKNITQLIKDSLAGLDHPQPEVIICIGLTARFLAKIIYGERCFTPDKLHGAKVTKHQLDTLQDMLASTDREPILERSMEPQSTDILELSIQYYKLMLDKFMASEFIVCYYGISTAYNLWNKRKRH